MAHATPERRLRRTRIFNCWIILVDPANSTVITLYKVDLGLDHDFEQEYINKMLERLNLANKDLEDTKIKSLEESNMYRNMIEEYNAEISKYRIYIKNLEELIDDYKNIIKNNTIKNSIAEQKVIDVVNDLIRKKMF